MTKYPHLRRWLAAVLSVGVVGALAVLAFLNSSGTAEGPKKDGGKEGPAKTEGWTMFGGTPGRNMVNTSAKGLPVSWDLDKKENVLWSVELGSKAYGGPIVAGDRVFVGTNNAKPRDKKHFEKGKSGKLEPIDLGIVMSFDKNKGDFLWQSVFFKLKAGRVVDWPEEGICSSPLVEGERMYFVSNRCEVICADVKTGETIWSLDMIGKLGVFPHNLACCSPLMVGDDLWLVTANGVDGGHLNVPKPKAPSFIKVAKKDGAVLWQDDRPTKALTEAVKGGDDEKAFFKRLVNRGELIQHGQWSNPAYGEAGGQAQVIFPGGDGWIYSYDPKDGKLLWRFDCNPKDSFYELQGKGTRNDFIATPVIYKERVYIGVGQDPEHEKGVGHLWCIDMKKGKDGMDVSPELVTDNSVFPPKTKPNPNSAALWHYGGYTTPADKKKLGRLYYFGRTMSTCAIKDDILYVAELQGTVHCLDANTGDVFWTHDTESYTWSSPYWADGKVYFGNDGGALIVFDHGKKKKILAENEMNGRVRATPVAVGDTLYVMTENRLWALRNKK